MWYENPTVAAILGGIAGAVLSVITSVIIWRKTQKIKRLDLFVRDVSSLLSVSEKIQNELKITYSGTEAKSVFLISIDIVNSGNQPIENQPLNVRLPEESKIIDYSFTTEPAVGFGKIETQQPSSSGLDFQIELLNPADTFSLEVVSLDNPSDSVELFAKNAGVDARVFGTSTGNSLDDYFLTDRSMWFLALMSAVPFFGGFARSMINVGVAQRMSKIGK